jgi:hypothetical protein
MFVLTSLVFHPILEQEQHLMETERNGSVLLITVKRAKVLV